MATNRAERVGSVVARRAGLGIGTVLAIVVGIGLIILAYQFVFRTTGLADSPPSNLEQGPPAVIVVQPTSTEVEPTQEPVPTATEPIVETPREDVQEWWERIVREAAKHDCEATYELVNVRETGIVNAIPWTVDQNGETVQGMIPIFCGTGAYLAFAEIGNKYPRGEVADWVLEEDSFFSTAVHSDLMLGPTHLMIGFYPRVLPKSMQGGLTGEQREKFHDYLACLGFGPDSLDQYYNDKLPSLAVPIGESLAKGLTGVGAIPNDQFYSQCLP